MHTHMYYFLYNTKEANTSETESCQTIRLLFTQTIQPEEPSKPATVNCHHYYKKSELMLMRRATASV